MTGPIALVGSGEYLPVMQDLETLLIAGRAPRYVQIPTAAAQEGPESLARWVALGQAQAERIGVESVPVVVRDRIDADDPSLAELVDGAGLIYLSGGNPPYVGETLRGTLVWEAIRRAWEGGAALAGCSAGAMAMTSWAPYVRDLSRDPDPGLGIFPTWRVLPHFDRIPDFDPGMLKRALDVLPDDRILIGIDEETALVRLDGSWAVYGRQAVHVFSGDSSTSYRAGEVVPV